MADYSYHPPGNFGITHPTPEEYDAAFASAPACHHDHGTMAREISEFLAGLDNASDGSTDY